MSDRVTVNIGPAILLDHQEPHFDAGFCVCGCPECAKDTGGGPGIVYQDCICPGCPCDGSGPDA